MQGSVNYTFTNKIKMIQAYSLYEGSFSVDSSKKFVPFDPTKDDPSERKGSLFVHVHPFLIVGDDGLILCDTGLGFHNADGDLLIHENMPHSYLGIYLLIHYIFYHEEDAQEID